MEAKPAKKERSPRKRALGRMGICVACTSLAICRYPKSIQPPVMFCEEFNSSRANPGKKEISMDPVLVNTPVQVAVNRENFSNNYIGLLASLSGLAGYVRGSLSSRDQWYWRADFFNHYDDRAIDLHAKYGAQLPSMFSTMHIYPINGAVQRVGNQETAWSYRDANFAQVIVCVDPDPANNDHLKGWAQEYWQALHPYSAGGEYVSMIMDEGEVRVKAAYR